MAKTEEEIADAEGDEEETSDEEDQDDEAEDEESDDTESKDSKDDEDDSEDDDESEEDSDSDDEDSKPLTRGDLKKFFADRKENRRNASRRQSEKGSDTKGKRPSPDTVRLDTIEKQQKQILLTEEKRTFGHENGLSPGEVDIVYKMTKRPTAKALKDPVINGALEGYRTSQRARNNIPGNGNGRVNRPSPKDEKNMTKDEKRERFSDRRREILASKQPGR